MCVCVCVCVCVCMCVRERERDRQTEKPGGRAGGGGGGGGRGGGARQFLLLLCVRVYKSVPDDKHSTERERDRDRETDRETERERESTTVLMTRPSARVIVSGGRWGKQRFITSSISYTHSLLPPPPNFLLIFRRLAVVLSLEKRGLPLTLSLPRCNLKTNDSNAKSKILRPFFFRSRFNI